MSTNLFCRLSLSALFSFSGIPGFAKDQTGSGLPVTPLHSPSLQFTPLHSSSFPITPFHSPSLGRLWKVKVHIRGAGEEKDERLQIIDFSMDAYAGP